jgi:hypothetical protein
MSRERVNPASSCLFQTLSSIRRTLDLETEPRRGGVPCCHHTAITLLKRSAGIVLLYRTVLPGQTLKTPCQKTRLRRRVLPPITGCASDLSLAVPTDLLLNHPHRSVRQPTLTRSKQASKQSIDQQRSNQRRTSCRSPTQSQKQYINPANLQLFPS